MSRKQLDKFLRLLKASPSGAVFNPWWQIDEENDIGPHCASDSQKTFTRLFSRTARQGAAGDRRRSARLSRWSFQRNPDDFGAHAARQTADIVAALSQRRNLLERADDGGRRPPLQIISGIKPRRTSKPSICPDGFSEPTATIVWGALLKIGVLPDEFVLWNAFPWHSFDPHRGLLSNRMPNKSEQLSGRPVLKAFLELFPCEQIVALGKIAAAQLEQLGVNAHCVRHPASGGAKLFRQQIAKIVR